MRRSGRWRGLFFVSFCAPFDVYLTCLLSRRTRHLPKSVYQASKLKRTMLDAQRVKEERRRKHSRAGETKPKPARKKVVLAEQT